MWRSSVIGYTKYIEEFESKSGQKYLKFQVSHTVKGGEYRNFSIVVFNQELKARVLEYLQDSDRVLVSGNTDVRLGTKEDGTAFLNISMVLESFEKLSGAKREESEAVEETPVSTSTPTKRNPYSR